MLILCIPLGIVSVVFGIWTLSSDLRCRRFRCSGLFNFILISTLRKLEEKYHCHLQDIRLLCIIALCVPLRVLCFVSHAFGSCISFVFAVSFISVVFMS